MKILIIGASQGTGALTVKAALAAGHKVTAFARTPQKLALEHSNLRLFPGDFHQQDAVTQAVKGQDAVIITASSTSLQGFRKNPRYFSQGTSLVIESMKHAGIRKLVVLSALGVSESRPLLPWLAQKLMVDFILKLPFADHERQEELVRRSGLDWIIARPSRLTNGTATTQYKKTAALEKVPHSISRANVANFLLEASTSERWVGKAVQLGG